MPFCFLDTYEPCSATVAGASAGLVLFGPLVGLILGAAANYAAKSEGEAGEAVRGIGKSVLDVYNYLAKLNTKYSIGEKVGEATKSAYSKIKESDGDGAVVKIEEVSGHPPLLIQFQNRCTGLHWNVEVITPPPRVEFRVVWHSLAWMNV